jgi:hypothetical protein
MRGKILLLIALSGLLLVASCSKSSPTFTSRPTGGGGTGGGPSITQHVTPDISAPAAGQNVTFTVAASGTGVTYSWASDGGSFVGTTGTSVQWSAGTAGTYHITVTVTDSNGKTTTDSYTITVGAAASHAPVFTPTGIAKTVSAELIGEQYSFTAEATDPGNDLTTFTWDDGTGASHGTFSGQEDTIDTPAGHGKSTVKWMTTTVGTYTITCKAADEGNESATATLTVNPGTVTTFSYVGKDNCNGCHPTKVASWLLTAHGTAYDRKFGPNGTYASYASSHACDGCHTVGYKGGGGLDNNGGGFVNATITPQFENIQCEDCHGSGINHNGNIANIKVVWDPATTCGTCHKGSHHGTFDDWQKSGHNYDMSSTTETPFLEVNCVKCHNGAWFGKIQIDGEAPPAANLDPSEAVNVVCATCHDPHDATNPAQLRTVDPVATSYDPNSLEYAGLGNLCMRCHGDRRTAAQRTDQITNGKAAYFGPHHNTQGAMLFGKSGFEYPGQVYTNSVHGLMVPDTCITCHMHTEPYSKGPPEVPVVTGHEFKPDVRACQTCHPGADSFDINGKQTEIQSLLDQLFALLPKKADGITVDGDPATTTVKQREAGWNYLAVSNDGSKGVHNYAYAKKLLQDSITDIQTP